MRLVTFERDGRATLGARVGSEVIDLRLAAPDLPADLVGLLQAGPGALVSAEAATASAAPRARVPIAEIKHLPLIPYPRKFVGIGLNYASHALGDGALPERPNFPGLYLRTGTSLTGHAQAIMRPRLSVELDYEAELAFIIGRTARHIPAAQALSYVAGYTCFNDGSLRDYNRNLVALSAGKNFDATGALGPEFVSADELPPGASGLSLETRRNGKVVQSENTANMWWSVAEIVELLSAIMTLEPGDVIATGTCGGCIVGQQNPDWLAPGEVIEVEIGSIGILRNPIEEER